MFKLIPIENDLNLSTWLQTQAKTYECQWLLAHSIDCVIWGVFDQTGLHLGCAPEKLTLATLQQCRIFGSKAEVLLWNNATSWQAVVLTDPADPEQYIDELHMLWGTKGEPSDQFLGFTTLSDGIQGMQHTVPLVFEPETAYFGQIDEKHPNHRPARLLVRHILDFDPHTGSAYIRASRLVELVAKEVNHD